MIVKGPTKDLTHANVILHEARVYSCSTSKSRDGSWARLVLRRGDGKLISIQMDPEELAGLSLELQDMEHELMRG